MRFHVRVARLGIAFVFVAAPATALETQAPIHTGATINFARLPEGHVPFPELKPPAHIPAGEQLTGFYLTGMPPEQERMMRLSNQHMGISYLLTTEAAARAYGTASFTGKEAAADTCLADGAEVTRRRGMMADDSPPTWPTRSTSELSFQFDTPPTPDSQPDVHAIHSERFVAGTDGRATLDIVDAWVDGRTRGVRLLNRSTLPLSRVFVGPNELEVFAARDGEALQIVLHSGKTVPTPQFVRDRLRQLVVTLPEQNVGVSDCGHLRFALRPPPGDGQMGTLQSTAFLPPSDEELATLGDPAASDHDMKLFRMMRQRAFQLSISASSASTDPHPIVSISLSWLGRERGSDF